jgi:tRNA-dependent cyclodipeptide synthase
MQLYTVRGGTRENVEAKKYTIGIGISLGTKWFSPENICEAAGWALSHTKDYVIIYVADTIHAINLSVRNRIPIERALRIAKRHGEEIVGTVQECVNKTLSREESLRIRFASWADIETPDHKIKVQYLYKLYETNSEFRARVCNIVKEWLSKDTRVFTEDEVNKFGTYILEELPELMNRVPAKGVIYDAYIYPFDGALTQFVEKLQTGEISSEVKQNIMDTPPKVFLEVH